MKPISFYNDLFRVQIFAFIDVDQKLFKEFMLKRYDYDVEDVQYMSGAAVECTKRDRLEIVIWTREEDIAALTHECLHAASIILRNRGVSFAKESEEVYAYLQEWIIMKIINKHNKLKEKKNESND